MERVREVRSLVMDILSDCNDNDDPLHRVDCHPTVWRP
jgi:hypothetical protein